MASVKKRIDIVIMAGGRGSRLGDPGKPLIKVCGKRMIDHVIEVARRVNHGKIVVCTRSDLIQYLPHVSSPDLEVLNCPGEDYVGDLNRAFNRVNFPLLVLPADMPFITSEILALFVERALEEEKPVANLVRCGSGERVETGISLFQKPSGDWVDICFPDAVELRDIDYLEDLLWAEGLCASMGEIGRRR